MKLYYIRITKTASTSLIYWMNSNNIEYTKHQMIETKEKLLKDIEDKSDYKFMCVVRNPWERAVSSWKFLYSPIGDDTTTLKSFKEDIKEYTGEISFKEFLSKPFEEMHWMEYNHSIPQYDFISDKNNEIDYLDHIGRFEDLEKTQKYILNFTNTKASLDLPMMRKTKHNSYEEYYQDNETKELFLKKYEIDLIKLGYPSL